MNAPSGIRIISDVRSLEGINGTPSPTTLVKKIHTLDQHARAFIERSPFMVLSTASDSGNDASPRGDASGFVKCLDNSTLLIPERPGNRIADSLRNIIERPATGILFFIPGMNETLRVNGDAFVTDHAPYLDELTARGKTPKLAIVVKVTEIYLHCAKAFVRSSLWDPSKHMERSELPTLGRMILEQINGTPPSSEMEDNVEQALSDDIRDNLY
jgi:PPOX class probable FMN-dependent enzyme